MQFWVETRDKQLWSLFGAIINWGFMAFCVYANSQWFVWSTRAASWPAISFGALFIPLIIPPMLNVQYSVHFCHILIFIIIHLIISLKKYQWLRWKFIYNFVKNNKIQISNKYGYSKKIISKNLVIVNKMRPWMNECMCGNNLGFDQSNFSSAPQLTCQSSTSYSLWQLRA
jgi:hypothetical protein